MVDIYKILEITDCTPDVKVKELYEKKMAEFQKQERSEEDRIMCSELKMAYNQLLARHQDWAKTIDDEKRCCANAQIEIEKMQSMPHQNIAEFLSIRGTALFSLIQTERYYLILFKKYCLKNNFFLSSKNEGDFLTFFEEQVEKAFNRYITEFDSRIAPLENLFNYSMTKRFPNALDYIKKKARSGDKNFPEEKEEAVQMSTEFNFYEILIDMSKFLTTMYLHGYREEKTKDNKKSIGQNETQYYRMIFTETVSLIALEGNSNHLVCVSHEREIFDTMEVDFLDFYTSKNCRTIYEIIFSPLKEYREIGIEKEGRIHLSSEHGGLEAKVYHRYFNHIGRKIAENSVNSLLSRYRGKYYKILKELKELWYDEFASYANTSIMRRREDGTYIQVNGE